MNVNIALGIVFAFIALLSLGVPLALMSVRHLREEMERRIGNLELTVRLLLLKPTEKGDDQQGSA